MSETESKPIESKPVNMKSWLVLGLRFIQLLTVSMVVVGFIWGTGDLILSLIPEGSAVTPLSLLLMLYGAIGSLTIEVSIRLVQRKK